MNIVLVDDDADARELISLALERVGEGHHVRQFAGAPEALSSLDSWQDQADLVLLDFHLGAGTGVDLARSMRDQGCLAPVAFVTAAAQVGAVRKACLEIGAVEVVDKARPLEELAGLLRPLTDGIAGTRGSGAWATG